MWTTTPWTLPSNMYAAVDPQFDYVLVKGEGDEARFVVAKELVEPLAKKLERTADRREGDEGIAARGARVRAAVRSLPIGGARRARGDYWRVLEADFVTLDTGTGIVHIAPAFGEDDYAAHRKNLEKDPELPLFCAVKRDGTFVDAMGKYAGRWVKDCDKEILHELEGS